MRNSFSYNIIAYLQDCANLQRNFSTEVNLGIFPVTSQTKIEFKQVLVHDLLTVLGLLNFAEEIEGLSDWIQNTAGRVDSQNLKLLDNVASIVRYSQGIHGYLVQLLGQGESAHNFGAMMTTLRDLDSEELQQVTIECLLAWATEQKMIGADVPFPTTPNDALVILDTMQKYRKDVWEAPPATVSFVDLAQLLFDADALHDQFMFAFDYVWHQFYEARWQEDAQQGQISLRYHLRQDYPNDVATVFKEVAGRALPDTLQNKLVGMRHITFLPCCHIGAYVIISSWRDKLWIGFNANLVTDEAMSMGYASVATLYPVLKSLADETRLKIVTYLQTQGERNVGDIADDMNLTISTTSRHLKLLAKTGILHMRRDGTMRYYTVNSQGLIDVGQDLQQLGESVLHHQQEQIEM